MDQPTQGQRLVSQTQEFEVSISRPNWFVRALVASAATVIAVLMVVLLSGVVAVGIALAIILGVMVWVRSWFRRQRRPNGMLDGRRNVRVVPARDPADPGR